MVSHEVNPQFLALLVLIAISAVAFVYSSDTAMRMEKQQSFVDYADPIYISNVLVAFMSGGVGGLGLLMLHRLAKQELET